MKFNEVKYQDARTKSYLGSPSIIRLKSGDLLATHDYFGPGAPLSENGTWHMTSVYRSSDEGVSWTNVTHISGMFWANLFYHQGALYLLGTWERFGSIVIRRSEDEGNTWTHSMDAKSGLLFVGGSYRESPSYHCAPVPICVSGSRIYRAFEDNTFYDWGRNISAFVISAPENADLLDASNWIMSNKLDYDLAWTPPDVGPLERATWLEGNTVEAPNGEVWNVLRFSSRPLLDKAVVTKVADGGQRLYFDGAPGVIDFPGGVTKFTIRRDSATGTYLTLSNTNVDPALMGQRSVLCLNASDDLVRWRHVETLLEDDSGLSPEESKRLVGFQYVDWQFDGDDIIYLSRTAYDGAHNFHDANRITFHKIEGYRGLL